MRVFLNSFSLLYGRLLFSNEPALPKTPPGPANSLNGLRGLLGVAISFVTLGRHCGFDYVYRIASFEHAVALSPFELDRSAECGLYPKQSCDLAHCLFKLPVFQLVSRHGALRAQILDTMA